ncbi:hypothetical protein BCR32DRAFT_282049 [Anaeromyces robustus]|uniref:Uncharacterized protein n=1 Tax=Anaeromyces robustus TaxID=1754192 RepID=A0A1Y1WZS0_9FUNG|nr:hypothetical protein BCR32DRAFT_282049 [Anaeromyces robustus]|eukprot:ORX78686.1 hypothetical protein BCR32DRAFT_282049 [Anaeromyces robustus]
MAIANEKGVSNKASHRAASNFLDGIPGFKKSATRSFIHAIYHELIGSWKEINGNNVGAYNERKRANDQWNQTRGKTIRRVLYNESIRSNDQR